MRLCLVMTLQTYAAFIRRDSVAAVWVRCRSTIVQWLLLCTYHTHFIVR